MTSSYRLWTAGWAVAGALAVATLGFPIWGIWTSDARGLIGLITLIPAIVAISCMAIWSSDAMPSRPARLGRTQRRTLRDERARIALESAIAQAEREAGLR
ncbi:hypothetical protein [Nocardioides kribbensis]|uniref:hypothetical protein n=1 Tax=Nocardioides kribbensis TaxID=305517 RepID=UPI00187B0A05|nr:hypothetical protein [Nocardioides kribbensis]